MNPAAGIIGVLNVGAVLAEAIGAGILDQQQAAQVLVMAVRVHMGHTDRVIERIDTAIADEERKREERRRAARPPVAPAPAPEHQPTGEPAAPTGAP